MTSDVLPTPWEPKMTILASRVDDISKVEMCVSGLGKKIILGIVAGEDQLSVGVPRLLFTK